MPCTPTTTTAAGTSPARRHPWCGGGLRPPSRPGRAAHGHGAGHRRVAAGRHARAVRHHDQALPPGRAARAGLMAALMAQQGFTASPRALEAPRGMMQTMSTKNDWSEITDGPGPALRDRLQHLQALCLRHRDPSRASTPVHSCARRGVRPEQVERIELKVHSLVLELTGKKEPADGLQAKFSVYHGCAAGLTSDWIGRSETLHDTIGPRRCWQLTATLDHPAAAVPAGTPLPPLWHWLYFLPLLPAQRGRCPTATPHAAASCRRCRCRAACGPAASSSSTTRCAWATRWHARRPSTTSRSRTGAPGSWCS
jgi:hypothetical protein